MKNLTQAILAVLMGIVLVGTVATAGGNPVSPNAVSAFPYVATFTSPDNIGGANWTSSFSGYTSGWTNATSGGQSDNLACVTITTTNASPGSAFLIVTLNTSGMTFNGSETFEFFYTNSAATARDAITVLYNIGAGDVLISGTNPNLTGIVSSYSLASYTLPSAMQNQASVALKIRIARSGNGQPTTVNIDNAILQGGALPITLASFSGAVVENNDVRLDWMTISEVNNLGFYVERRAENELSFTELPNSFVPGHGTTVEPQEYTWTNASVPQGTYEYRLRQVDLDGTTHYSHAIEVIVSSPLSVGGEAVPAVFTLNQNYPNPFNPSTKISFSLAEANFTTVKVYNVLGQQVATLFSGMADAGRAYVVNFDASTIGNGIYFYRLESGSKVDVKKMTLLK
jgi:hypothetical protein